MKLEDYSKYYIQGSDHYLIPTDEFEELFNEMNNWREETKELKEIIKGKTICYDEEEHRELKDRIDKAIEILKLCNSKCSKETIKILKGENNE